MGCACGKGLSTETTEVRPERKRLRSHSIRRMDAVLAESGILKEQGTRASEADQDLSPSHNTTDSLSPLSPKKSMLLRRSQRLRDAIEALAVYLEATRDEQLGKSKPSVDNPPTATPDLVKKRRLIGNVYDILNTHHNVLDIRCMTDEFHRFGWLQGCQELKNLISPHDAQPSPRQDSWVDEVSPLSPREYKVESEVRTAEPSEKVGREALNDIPQKRAAGLSVVIPGAESPLGGRAGSEHSSLSSPRHAHVGRVEFIDAFLSLKMLGCLYRSSEPDLEQAMSPTARLRLALRRRKPAVLKGYRIQPFCAYSKRIKCIRHQEGCPLVAICMKDSITAQVFNIATGNMERVYSGHCDCIFDVCISPDKKYLATASRDSTLIIWDLTCGYLVKQFSHPGPVTCCTFCEKHEILTGCYDSVVRKFDVAKGFLMQTPEPEESKGVIVTILATPEVVALTRTRVVEVELLSYATLTPLACLSGHETLIWMLHCRPSTTDNMLSVCERRVNVWKGLNHMDGSAAELHCSIEVSSGERHNGRSGKESWLAAQFLPLPYDHYIVASSYDLAVSIYDMQGLQLLHFYHRYPIYCISSPTDDTTPYLGDSAGNVLLLQPL